MDEVGTRERLIQAALAHINASGLDGLTLRSIARDAGVSHGAPARHFEGVASLLSAVTARSFDELTDSLHRHIENSGDEPLNRLRASGAGYLEFALAHPAEYELMFRPERLDRSDDEYLRASVGAFSVLQGLVAIAQETGWRATADSMALTGVVWAGMHGIASLWIQGSLPMATDMADIDPITELLYELIGQGENK